MSDATLSNASCRRRVGGLFLLALAHRAAIALWTTTLAADGAYHLMTAEWISEGRIGHALGSYFMHPLNPALTAAAGALFGGVEAGGYVVGVLMSSLAVLPLWALTRRFWDERHADWAALLYALHPTLALEGAEVLNTGTYLAVFLAALALGVFAIDRGSWLRFALAGAASGLAYLTRPEGLLVGAFLIVLGGARAVALRRRGEKGLGRLAAGVALAFLVGLLVASPYLLWIRSHTREWAFTTRIAAQKLLDPESEGTDRQESAAYQVQKRTVRALYLPLVPFLALGLAVRRGMGQKRATLAWALVIAAATMAPSILLYLRSGTIRPSHRYFLIAAALLLPWTAAGVLFLRDRLEARLSRPVRWVAALVLAAICLPKTAGPHGAEEAAYRDAGEWIARQGGPEWGSLVTWSEKPAWYARRRPAPLPVLEGSGEARARRLREACLDASADFLVLDDRTLRRSFTPEFPADLESAGFERAATFEARRKGGMTVWVYRIRRGS